MYNFLVSCLKFPTQKELIFCIACLMFFRKATIHKAAMSKIFSEILEQNSNGFVDAEVVMRELGSEVIEACPPGVNFHAARTVVDCILSDVKPRSEEENESE